MEKDELMHEFYKNGSFPYDTQKDSQPEHWEFKPSMLDWAMLFISWASLFYSIPIYLMILKVVIIIPMVHLFFS